MPNEFPTKDPQQIWQNQPKEELKMSSEQMRQRAQQRQRKSKSAAVSQIVIGLILSVFFGHYTIVVGAIWPRLGFAILTLWCLYSVYVAYKWVWPRNQAPDFATASSFEFYRSELERRRDYGKHIWRRAGLTFCFLGLAMIIVPALINALQHAPHQLLNMVPLFVLLIFWFPAFFYFRKRGQRRVQQEIDELSEFQRRA